MTDRGEFMKARRYLWLLAACLLTMAAPLASAQAPTPTAPRVIEISAKRFEFAPSAITVKRGETVLLRLKSADVTHGFYSKQLKIDEVIQPGKTLEVKLTPQTAGTFIVICDHFCGSGHGNMKMTIVVE
jgi:cytochrome c oxidase subunit 2